MVQGLAENRAAGQHAQHGGCRQTSFGKATSARVDAMGIG
jgi:hypothetical protein